MKKLYAFSEVRLLTYSEVETLTDPKFTDHIPEDLKNKEIVQIEPANTDGSTFIIEIRNKIDKQEAYKLMKNKIEEFNEQRKSNS